MRTILHNNIQPPMLHGSRGFFFDPPMGDGRGEGGVGGGGQANQQQQQPPANQQQQPPANQQQQQAPADPFAGIDLDMQPDHVRQAIEASRATLQSLQTQAQQGAQAVQTVQQMQQEVERMRAQILQQQQPGNQPGGRQPQGGEPPTVEQRLEQYYISQNIPPAQAKQFAAMNKGAFEIFGEHLQQQIGGRFAPIAGRVVEDSAQQAFQEAIAGDRVGWSASDEIKQALWDRTQALAEAGQIVNPAVVTNLAKIFYVDHLERTGGQPFTPGNVVPINQPHTIPNMTPGFVPQQQQSRFSYPGAGNVTMPRHTSNSNATPLDAETAAALAATSGNWPAPLQDALKRKQAGGR